MLKEYRTLLPFFKKYSLKYFVGLLFLVLVDAAQLLIPQFIKEAIDSLASGSFILNDLIRIGLEIMVVAIFISSGRFLWRYFIHGSSRKIEAEMREKLFAHLMDMSSVFYQKNKTGDLMARATNDMSAIRQASGMGFVTFIDGVFMSFAILAVMFIQNPQVSLYTIIPLPIISVLIIVFGTLIGKRFKRVQEVYSKLSDLAQETISGIRIVKTFVRERFFDIEFAKANDSYKDANMSLVTLFGLFFPLINFLAGLTSVLLLFFGGNAVLNGSMSAGGLVATIAYLEMLIWPMIGAGFTVNILQRGAASLKRINEILDTKPEIESCENAFYEKDIKKLELRNLNFKYADKEVNALTDISFTLEKGMTLGILGKIGSGKTTLLKLLPRILNSNENEIFLNDVDIKKWDLQFLRKVFGFVPQETFLFSDTIRNNIAFFDPSLSDAEIYKLISIASLDRDLLTFKDGIETMVGEKGLSLSGGQKQRISIARALAPKPEILVFDDALSSVDAETEKKLLESVLQERKGKTNILVSHRVSTLKNADLILVLENGTITQKGTHEELMQLTKGFYAEIARLQDLENIQVTK